MVSLMIDQGLQRGRGERERGSEIGKHFTSVRGSLSEKHYKYGEIARKIARK